MLEEELLKADTFIKNQYFYKYLELVKRSSDVGEKHHALPKSLFPQFAKSEWNLVKLSYKDHYLAHELLPLFVSGLNRYKMLCAWNQMCGRTKGEFVTADQYATLKQMFSDNNPSKDPLVKAKKIEKQKIFWSNPENVAKHSGENHHHYGKKMSDENREKLRLGKLGIPSPFKGKERPELKGKMAGENNPMASKIIIDGVLYKTKTDAAKAHGVTLQALKHWLKTGRAVDPSVGVPAKWKDGRTHTLLIDGIVFNTATEASNHFNVSLNSIRNWVIKGKATKLPPNWKDMVEYADLQFKDPINVPT